MAQNKPLMTPFELEISGIRIGGKNPNPVAVLIQAFLNECSDRPEVRPNHPVHVLLDSSILEEPGLAPTPASTVVLNLESIELVRSSGEHRGDIRWFSVRDPKELVGPLLDHYRGTYFRSHTSEIIYSNDSDLEALTVSKEIEVTAPLLAAVCAAREAGIPREAISRALKKSNLGTRAFYRFDDNAREAQI